MSLSYKDLIATLLTALVVLVFFATHESWNVWLVGDSHRWAGGVVFLLGAMTCGLGSPTKDAFSKALGVLGALALALAIVAIATGSLTALSLLATDIVTLWAVSTYRHAAGAPQQPHPV